MNTHDPLKGEAGLARSCAEIFPALSPLQTDAFQGWKKASRSPSPREEEVGTRAAGSQRSGSPLSSRELWDALGAAAPP